MLKQRILTALILAPLALAGVFFLPMAWYAILVGAVSLIGAWEWGAFIAAKNTDTPEQVKDNGIIRAVFTFSIALLLISFVVVVPVEQIWQQGQLHPLYLAALLIGAVWWLMSMVMVFCYPKSEGFWSQSEFYKGFFGQLTLIPFWVGMMAIRTYGYENDPLLGGFLILAIFVIVWGADVGAYFVGRQFGRHKLMPKVSPGKTLEGVAGGVVTALVATLIANHYFYQIEMTPLLILVFITTIASVFGDLSESMFKRSAKIKDSGNILPGHGGILDRIDSLTAAVPLFTLVYLLLVV